MKTYEIKRMTEGGDWSDKPIIDIDTPYLDTPDTVKAWAQIAYDDNAIFVHLWTEEYQHRAVETGPVGAPYEDCCLEFFFSPMEGDPDTSILKTTLSDAVILVSEADFQISFASSPTQKRIFSAAR